MKKMKVFSYLALGLGVAQILLMLTSWLLTAAMPENYNRSLLSSEGIRWFFGQFQDHAGTYPASSCHPSECDGRSLSKQFYAEHHTLYRFCRNRSLLQFRCYQ